MAQIPNPNFEEDEARYTKWQEEEKLRAEAAKKLVKPKKGRKKAAQEALESPPDDSEVLSPLLEVPPLEVPPKPPRPKKNIEIVLHGIWGQGVKGKLAPDELTATSAAPVSIKVLK